MALCLARVRLFVGLAAVFLDRLGFYCAVRRHEFCPTVPVRRSLRNSAGVRVAAWRDGVRCLRCRGRLSPAAGVVLFSFYTPPGAGGRPFFRFLVGAFLCFSLFRTRAKRERGRQGQRRSRRRATRVRRLPAHAPRRWHGTDADTDRGLVARTRTRARAPFYSPPSGSWRIER